MAEALEELGDTSFATASVANLGKTTRRLLDQMAYRYVKLQDTLGERLLPALLE